MQIKGTFKLKNDSIRDPAGYLGSILQKNNVNGVKYCKIVIVDSIRDSVDNIQETIKGYQIEFPLKPSIPMVTYYLPELESTPGQEYGDINYLQDFIGMLCW